MEIPKHIFRAYDIRGLFNVDLFPEYFTLIGKAVATYENNDFIIGCDVRYSSTLLKYSLIAGILSTGHDVYDIGIVPIGAAFYSILFFKKMSLAYITASHLPPEWNGVKLCHRNGLYFTPSEIKKLYELIKRKELSVCKWNEVGKIHKRDIIYEYIDFLCSLASKISSLRVILDLGNGATSIVAPKVFRRLGLHVFSIFEDVDPTFSGRGPEPTPEKLKILGEIVKKLRADVGIAYDGDGDRVMFTDENGTPLLAEQAAIVFFEGGLKGNIVASIDCSAILDEYIESRGYKVIRIPVGHTYMVRKVIELNAPLGVEHSGHFAVGKYSKLDDGILASIKFCEALSNIGEPISKIVPKPYPSIRFKVKVDDHNKFKVIEILKEKYEKEYSHIETIDGIRIIEDNYWVLIRPSNTEPIIRISIEAKSKELLKSLPNKFISEVKEVYAKIRRG